MVDTKNTEPKTLFNNVNKEQHYFSIFESHSYFPKPSKYVMEQVKSFSNTSSENSEKKIVKSTLEGLVIHLTNPIDSVNYNDLHDFFIVYRDFMTGERLLEIILYRFKWSISRILPMNSINSTIANRYSTTNIPTLSSANGTSISDDEELIKLYAIVVVRVFVMIRHWITNYFIEDFLYNDTLFLSFVSFFDNEITGNLLLFLSDSDEYKNLKMILNCIVTLKKQWVNKVNECFTDPYYLNIPTSPDDWIRYLLITYEEHTNLHNSKRLSIFALKNSTDPTWRNKSFMSIIGNKSVRLPNADQNKDYLVSVVQKNTGMRNVSKSKQSILFPKNFNYMTAYNNELHLRKLSDDTNTITSNYRNFSGISTSKDASVISDMTQQVGVIDIPKNNKRIISVSTNGESLRDSRNSSSKLDYIQVLNVPETSTIDMILPSTPAKKLEFTISLDDLIGDQKNYINEFEENTVKNSSTDTTDLSVRHSIYGLLNKWGTTGDKNTKSTESSNDLHVSVVSLEQNESDLVTSDNESQLLKDSKKVNKFVRYVFSIGAINNGSEFEQAAAENKDSNLAVSLIKEGEHRFDILSARSIDEVQYIINKQNAQFQDADNTLLKIESTDNEAELNQMDNLNLYNTVVQIANNVLSSTKKNQIKKNLSSKRFSQTSLIDKTPATLKTTSIDEPHLEYESPEKNTSSQLNFTTSPFLRSIEKTKTEISKRDWIKKSPTSTQLFFEFDKDSFEEAERNEPPSPTPNKHITKDLHHESLTDANRLMLKVPEVNALKSTNTTEDVESEANETILELPESSENVSEILHSNGHLRNSSVQSYQSMYSFIKQELPTARNSGRISISSGHNNLQIVDKIKARGSLKVNNLSFNENQEVPCVSVHASKSYISRTPSILENASFVNKDGIFQQQQEELRKLSAKISSTSLRKDSSSLSNLSQRSSGINSKKLDMFYYNENITPFESPLLNTNQGMKMSPTFTNINNFMNETNEQVNVLRSSSDEKGFVSGISSVNTDILFHDALSAHSNYIPNTNVLTTKDVHVVSSDVPRRWTTGLNLHLSDLEPIAQQNLQSDDVAQVPDIGETDFYENEDDSLKEGDDEISKSVEKLKQTDLRQMFKDQFQNDNVSNSRLSFMIYGEEGSDEGKDEIFEKKHNLDCTPEAFNRIDESSFSNDHNIEEEAEDDINFEDNQGENKNYEGENPLDIAMRKLEGTFEEIENQIDLESQEGNHDRSDKEEHEDLGSDTVYEDNEIVDNVTLSKNNIVAIAKSKSVNNIIFKNKRASILVKNRRKTLLSTTNLKQNKENYEESLENQDSISTDEISTGIYITDLLSDYTIKDSTLLISNHNEHIPFIMMYSSRDIAHQMTLIERDVLNEVDWKSLLQLQMNENLKTYTSWLEVLVNQDELSGIDLGVARFNLTVDWIISEIVLTKDVKLKRNVLQKYIHVAEHCIRLQNFNTSMQIVLGLSSIEVQYFKESWRLVEPGDMLIWAEMKNLFSSEHNDYKGLRELMNDMEPIRGCLPFLVLYLSDLKNLANMSTFFQSNHDIVNYQKFHSLATIVKNFIQRVKWGIEFYQLESNPQLLSKCLYISSLREEEISQLINERYD
ncbi:hypothetical protein QEN19_000558 [Hanseniaspora menglaensis]